MMTAIVHESFILPRLPPELERKIFEQAAHSSFQRIPTLMLTSWRVKIWLEPILYRVVIDPELVDEYEDYAYLPNHTLLQKLRTRPPSSVGLFVRHILWELSARNSNDLLVALALCAHVTDLFILGNPDLMILPAINGLQNLSHLAIHVQSLYPSGSSIDFTSHLFRRLTHLELLCCDFRSFPDALVGLGAAPNLTHVSFNAIRDAAAVHEQIHKHTNLRCIVFFEVGPAKHLPSTADDRFVAVRQTRYITDWLRGVTRGNDYWWLVERFIDAKRAGKVERSRYMIRDDDASWQS
ncbi:hypothetical protein R3P38DRAFT_497054 [Favolaschia claudopus]|uniref:F-box domain-containing protein n=1 Tax=Favolaschia claudopus TaxID=2862362 RepID=A0AAW0CQP0_9AGAR